MAEFAHTEGEAAPQRPSGAAMVVRYFVACVATLFGVLLLGIGVIAIEKRYFYSTVGLHHKPWFPYPLFGTSAVYAGIALVCAGACCITMVLFAGVLRRHCPPWTRWLPWVFFVAWFIFLHLSNRRE